MLNAENIFLVGPMGSGKSAVGRQLASRLGFAFLDSDAEIEARTGVEVSYIFEREGEAGFREREAEVLDELTRCRHTVIATGGGAVLVAATRACLQTRGCVVYLRTSVDQQLARTRRSTRRPLLMNPDPRGTLLRLAELRSPLYQEVADITVDTDGRRVRTVVEDILRRLEAARGHQCSA
jgi:shikimate kinase